MEERDLELEKIRYNWRRGMPFEARLRFSLLAYAVHVLTGAIVKRAVILAVIGIGVIFTGYMLHQTPTTGLIAGIGIGLILAGLFIAWIFQGYFDN